MTKQTDLKAIVEFLRSYAKATVPKFDDSLLLHHVLFDTQYISEKIIHPEIIGKRENGFLRLDKDNINQAIDAYCDILSESKDVGSIFIHIRKADRLQLLDYVKGFMTVKEYSKILADIWVLTEFPHQLSNILLINLFNGADRQYLMDDDENKVWNNLKDNLVVYRGIQKLCDRKGKQRGLSWTLSKKVAEWFAKRWENNGERIFQSSNPMSFRCGKN
jgi:hypothetical protein